jgi:hypothetical protein
MREATRPQTVKKQTSTDLVHNAVMSRTIPPASSRAAIAAVALLTLLAACVSTSPPPTAVPSIPPSVAPSATPQATVAPPSPTATTTVTPTEAATETPAASETPPEGTAAPTVEPELAAQINAVTVQVPPIRELDATSDVPYQFVSRDDFRQELIDTADEDTTPEWRAAEERFLKRMGMLPADADLQAMLVDLYGAEVAAYYRPETGTFYIIERDKPFGPSDKVTVAHEYTHALQDQHFDLEGARIKDPAEGDAILAQLAVIEGDATLTSQEWMIANLTPQEQIQLLNEALGELDTSQLENMPLVLRRQLEFPYTEGFLFTRDIYGLGGYEAVNQALQTPPASTEQILHSDKYYAGEQPVAVNLTDLTSTLGEGWSNVYQQTMGELNVQILATGGEQPPVNIPGLPVEWPHQEVAAGWGGDRLNMYEGPDGAWLIDWQTAWDSNGDAQEFAARMNELQSTFGGESRVVVNSEGVKVVIASDPALLPAILGS